MIIWRITLIATSDFHTSSEAKGSTIDYLRNIDQIPYIPGTHIKGVMRTEAERILRSTKGIDCWITGDIEIEDASEDKKRPFKTCEELKIGKYGCDVCRVFGMPHFINDKNYREGKIRVTDFTAKGSVVSASRMHVSIDRNSLSKTESALFRTRVVPAGCQFTGYIITKVLNENEKKLLKGSMYSMVHYGLGGERSRGLGSFDIESFEPILYDDFLKEGGNFD
ncbi:MAG: hypothetical protein E4G94_01560 [ANME-2 cluster archaeon]|nr:MAG: hypothetical protein E4G94_01560 [ANME-2 cluster archaeon]